MAAGTAVPSAVAAIAGGALVVVAGPGANWTLASNVTHSVLLLAAGWWLLRSRDGRRVGGLLVGTGAAGAATLLAAGWTALGWPGWQVAAWLQLWLWALFVVPLFTVLPAIFPDGRPPARAWRWVPWLGAAATAVTLLDGALGPGPLPTGEAAAPANPIAVSFSPALGLASGGAVVVAVLAALASLAVRWRHGNRTQRQQLKFVWYALGVAITIELVGGLMPRPLAQVGYFLIPVLLVGAIALSVRRYRLYDIDPFIRRTVVLAVLTALIFAVYLAVVSALGTAVGPAPGLALIASAVVAATADPVRRRVQREATRWLFGQREEPLEALAALREQLRAVADPSELPATTATVVARALRAPYVSVRLLTEGVHEEVARVGGPAGEPSVEVPLEWRGELVGTLTVGPRVPGEAYSRADLALLAELAHGIGSALHAVRLATELRVAQERAVHARADERRRLRHDLHDGLGPLLSGIGLALDGVRRTTAMDDQLAGELRLISGQVRSAATAVRRIIDAMQPAAVADLGLVQAVAEHLDRCAPLPGAPSFRYVHRGVPDADVPAVSEAAYLVVLEAVANVLRHAEAAACTVTLTGGARLTVQVDDDGRGIGDRYIAGVGTGSMRRRVRELGGQFELGPRPGGGTRVRAVLPVGGNR
ncbi:histidine kinase [Micromonospora soli]|uniref:sensor histidine kinase n=1 Tax=Micromonospora sp. NBRC 110009 TaxID=3061627 RepID=UPI00267372E1|nr:ATP-binding protein [Micromonospora sp. NBRC 110009]WKT99851.1 histidine kinase [Micromonospora sp. NBRC 110009]